MALSELVGLSVQMALSRQLEIVSNNVANLNTNGFKSDHALFEEFLSPDARQELFQGNDARVAFVHDRGAWHNLAQGPTQTTGNPLDVAIDGDAFLVVQTPSGERYTRNGAMQISSTGQLVNGEGMPILGENGPITLQQSDRNIVISQDGRVSVNEGQSIITEGFRGKLRLVRFAQPQVLQKDGSNNFAAPDGVLPEPATNARLQQGALEKSNVNGVLEMTRLIEITRTYTQVSNILQQQADMRRSAIQQLSDVPASA
jgi:flagellar basal-body rod protein FlgF/flagellar basal-body rod protein FlgG